MKRPRRLKKSLTILEVMIALSLAAIIMTFLLTAFRQITKETYATQKIKETKILPEQRAHLRLTQIFAEIATAGKENILPFHTAAIAESSMPALLFSYRSDVDPDPAYTGILEGMIYWDREKRLCFVTWPGRKEILLEGVDTFEWGFFDPKKKEWEKTWSAKSAVLPPMVRMDSKDKWNLVFFPAGASQEVTWRDKR